METARIISEADIIPNRAAGALYVTILDLIKWDAALSSGRILSKASFAQIWSPVRLTNDSLHPYGFGCFLSPVNGPSTIQEAGKGSTIISPAISMMGSPSFKPIVENLFGTPDTFNLDLFSKNYLQKAKSVLKSNLSLLNLFGPVQSIEMVGSSPDKNGTTLHYRVRYKAGSRVATVTRAKSGEI